MRGRLTIYLTAIFVLIFTLLLARQFARFKDLPRAQLIGPKLRLLAYSSFMAPTGPGPDLIAQFEEIQGIKVEVTTVGDAGLLLERLKLGERSKGYDVVIGLDQLMLSKARAQTTWRSIEYSTKDWHSEPAQMSSPEFVPYNWSPLTFIYRGDGPAPKRFDDLLDPQYRKQFALQNPRLSSPGFMFYQWVRELKGEGAKEFLRAFKPNVHSISPSWSFSYGLFQKGQVKFVFSYVTSLAFHWGTMKERDFHAMIFPEGHPVQVEYMAVSETCNECEAAESFVRFLLEPASQTVIMLKNYMRPVRKEGEAGTVFAELPQVKGLIPEKADEELRDWDVMED